jgi:uncharacterized membrane protein (DUF2068 family)
VLAAIGGAVEILIGAALLGLGTWAAGLTGVAILGGMGTVFGIAAIVLGIAELVLSYGLWTLKPWGWTLGVALAAIALAFIVVQAVVSGNIVNSLVGSIISIVVWLIVLYYLFTPRIKSAFGRP